MKLYFDSLTTLKVIHAESPIVIFFGTYGIYTRVNGPTKWNLRVISTAVGLITRVYIVCWNPSNCLIYTRVNGPTKQRSRAISTAVGLIPTVYILVLTAPLNGIRG